MPRVALEIQADFENISRLSLLNREEFPWRLRVRCTSCGEETAKEVVFHADDRVEQARGATVNLCVRCRLCERENSISVLDESRGVYTEADSGQWVQFSLFECRGLEPVSWSCADELDIQGTEGFTFEDAALESWEFFGYDEQLKHEVSITGFQYRFVKL